MGRERKKHKNITYYYRYSNKIVTVCKTSTNKPVSYFHSEKEPLLEGEIITVFGDFIYKKWNVVSGELLFYHKLGNTTGILSWGLSGGNLVYIHKADRIILNNVDNDATVVKYINYHPSIIYLENYHVIGCNGDSYTL
ncbi:MAG TPA: hypothetical protein PK891_07555, partial [Bacteroidales bacterium]|nr:hypothetical protein [Bacteroidales bacterium]